MSAEAHVAIPDKLSELLSVALDDLERAEDAPGYTANLNEWYKETGFGVCEVCLAGSFMVFSLGLDYSQVLRALDAVENSSPECKGGVFAGLPC